MIAFLEGTLVEALPTQITISVQGVGYQVFIPLSSFDYLPLPGASLRILTQLIVREDAHLLYGFISTAERDLFRLLINHVSGIGPKLALAVLSGMSVSRFQEAVIESDIAAISKISGLGKKSAERIVLELRDKLGVAATWEASSAKHHPSAADLQINDTILALISLGYKQVEAQKAARSAAQQLGPGPTSEALLRLTLQMLS